MRASDEVLIHAVEQTGGGNVSSVAGDIIAGRIVRVLRPNDGVPAPSLEIVLTGRMRIGGESFGSRGEALHLVISDGFAEAVRSQGSGEWYYLMHDNGEKQIECLLSREQFAEWAGVTA